MKTFEEIKAEALAQYGKNAVVWIEAVTLRGQRDSEDGAGLRNVMVEICIDAPKPGGGFTRISLTDQPIDVIPADSDMGRVVEQFGGQALKSAGDLLALRESKEHVDTEVRRLQRAAEFAELEAGESLIEINALKAERNDLRAERDQLKIERTSSVKNERQEAPVDGQ